MLGGIGMPELLLIGGVALLIFGPSRLSELGGSLGKGIRNFKSAMSGEESPPAQPDRAPGRVGKRTKPA